MQLQTSTNSSTFVEKVKDVTTFLMMDAENWPQSFGLPLSFMLISFSYKFQQYTVRWSNWKMWFLRNTYCITL